VNNQQRMISDATARRMAKYAAKGWSTREIAARFGRGKTAVQTAIRRVGGQYLKHSRVAEQHQYQYRDREARDRPRRCWECGQLTIGSGPCQVCQRTSLDLGA